MRLTPVLALPLLFSSCEIRIGTGGSSGVTFSSFSLETSGSDGESIFLRGKGSYSLRNGRVGKLGEGSRVYFRRDQGAPEESEIFARRRGDEIETAILRQGKVEALSPQDLEWVEEKVNAGGLRLVPSHGIEAENARILSLRGSLGASAIDWKAVEAGLKDAIFPSAVLPEILQTASRPAITPDDERGLFDLAHRDEPFFRHGDRDRVVETLVAREDLSATGIAAAIANLDEIGYSKREALALKLLTKPSFDATAAQGLLDAIDDLPYDGRAQVLAAMGGRGEMCPVEDWLEAVLDEAPYDRRTRLVLDALATPASAAASTRLARATLARLDDFPYDRRAAVFSRCVEASFEKDDVVKLVDRVFDDIPYHERRRTLESMTEHPALGAAVTREVIRRVDDLPYDARADFLVAASKRGDLTPSDQVKIVRQTLEEVSYNSRAKVLRVLLANPQCSAEAREAIWRHRKDLPSGQREEIEELFRK